MGLLLVLLSSGGSHSVSADECVDVWRDVIECFCQGLIISMFFHFLASLLSQHEADIKRA